MYVIIQGVATLALCLTMLLPGRACAEELFSFDGLSAVGTVQDIASAMKEKGYEFGFHMPSAGRCYTDCTLFAARHALPKSITNPAEPYRQYNLLQAFAQYFQEFSIRSPHEIGFANIFVHCISTPEKGGGSILEDLSPVVGITVVGSIIKTDVLPVFTERYGKPKQVNVDSGKTACMWENSTQRAYLCDDWLLIINRPLFADIAVRMLKDVDAQILKEEQKVKKLEAEKRARI